MPKYDNNKKSKQLSESSNSNVLDEFSEDQLEKTIDEGRERFIENEFKESVVKYIHIDDLIRQEMAEHREKLINLKTMREDLEGYIIKYLDAYEEERVNLGDNQHLTKTQSVRKACINKQLIQDSIFEQLKKEKMIKDEHAGKLLAEKTYELIESKREQKVRTYLKRTMPRKKKNKDDTVNKTAKNTGKNSQAISKKNKNTK